MNATTENDRRTNPTWAAFLAKYRIRDIVGPDDGYTVVSASGSTYHVSNSTHMDAMGSYSFRWHCDCPARKRCRHIDAVEQMVHDEACAAEDHDALEWIERFEH
jgi:hypothetical protein